MCSGGSVLGVVREYWQVGGEGRKWLLSYLRSDSYVGVNEGKFGCGKEKITGRYDKVGGKILYLQKED